MGLELITDETEPWRLRILDLQEILDLGRPVNGRFALSATAKALALQGLGEEADGGGAVPLVFIVVALGLAFDC
jgi:hypothetical protein